MLFIFTGTSGSGRKTIAHMVGESLGFTHVRSYTTRPPRSHDVNRTEYMYTSEETFRRMAADGEFVEHVVIDGYSYGIRRDDLLRDAHSGRHAYVIVNRYGASDLKKLLGDDAYRIFLYVSKSAMLERLESKGFHYEVIERYSRHYPEEVGYRKECEYVIENVDKKDTAIKVKRTLEAVLIGRKAG